MEAFRSNLVCYPLRILPGNEVKSTLLKFVQDNKLQAPFILTCCGGVTKCTIRMATEKIKTVEGSFEVLSLTGTLSGERGHQHVSLGDAEGQTIGGHLVGDMIVGTTIEVVLGDATDCVFTREHSDATGFQELTIKKK